MHSTTQIHCITKILLFILLITISRKLSLVWCHPTTIDQREKNTWINLALYSYSVEVQAVALSILPLPLRQCSISTWCGIDWIFKLGITTTFWTVIMVFLRCLRLVNIVVEAVNRFFINLLTLMSLLCSLEKAKGSRARTWEEDSS